jgi:small subunit ribosomal protein S2
VAEEFVHNLAAEGRTILFVGTKRQAQDAVAEEAQRAGMYFVNQRWLGGLLTNFTTIQRSLPACGPRGDGDRRALRDDHQEGDRPDREGKKKLQKNSKGSATCRGCPTHLRRRYPQGEDRGRRGAQAEDSVIGVVDTNCDPDEVDFVIPGNDDALRAIRLFASKMADAVLAGRGIRRVEPGGRRRRRRRRRSRPPPAPEPSRAARGGRHHAGVSLGFRHSAVGFWTAPA